MLSRDWPAAVVIVVALARTLPSGRNASSWTKPPSGDVGGDGWRPLTMSQSPIPSEAAIARRFPSGLNCTL